MVTAMVTATATRIRIVGLMRNVSRATLTKTNFIRLLLIISFGALLAYASATSALVSVARTKNYQTALALDDKDPTALAVKADNLFFRARDRASLTQVRQLASASLQSQALNARAMRLLAYSEEKLAAAPKSRAYIDIATRLSRRELGAQIWLIEQYVAADDAAGALRHYDTALRTNTAIQLPLFTQLTAGIELPIIQQALAPYVRADPPWLRSFLTHAIGNSANPASIVSVVKVAGGMPEHEAFRDLEKQLLSQLFAKGQFAVARKYYLGLPGAKPSVLTSLGFDADNMSSRSGPLGWQLVQGASTGANWSGGEGDQALTAFANSGERGLIARKWLFLAPGNYRIDLTFGTANMPDASAIEWTINCLSEAPPVTIWRSGPMRPVSGTKAKGTAQVGYECPFQSIEIAMAGGESQNGAELSVQSVQIARQR